MNTTELSLDERLARLDEAMKRNTDKLREILAMVEEANAKQDQRDAARKQ